MRRRRPDVREVITREEVAFWRDRFREWTAREDLTPADLLRVLDLWTRWEQIGARLYPDQQTTKEAAP